MDINEHFPYAEQREKQKVALDFVQKAVEKGYSDIVIAAPTGCHAKGQQVTMLDGSRKRVEDLAIGERLLGVDGSARTILNLCRGHEVMADVVPTVGKTFRVNLNHVLTIAIPSGDVWFGTRKDVDVRLSDWLKWPNVLREHSRLFKPSKVLVNGYWLETEPDAHTTCQLKSGLQVHVVRFKVELRPTEDYYGFTLDGDGRYMLDDFTVTHNSGKTGLGVAACDWQGGYYLTGQKMLQDQIEKDCATAFKPDRRNLKILKNKGDYPCGPCGNCGIGLAKSRPPCRPDDCSYLRAKSAYLNARTAVTNYAFAITEHVWSGMFPQREILVLDEAHTIERQLMNFLEVAIDDRVITAYAPSIIRVPQENFTLNKYRKWIADELVPAVTAKLDAMTELSQGNEEQGRQVTEQASYLHQLEYSLKSIDDTWVFWSTQEAGKWTRHQAKPVNVAPFVEPLLLSLGKTRIHMSAYPTTKDVYCRTLGLDPERTAWAGLGSTFPVENRGVVFCKTGSMGRKSFDTTFPNFTRVLLKILASHKGDKGIIHSTSYELGKKIVAAITGKVEHLILFSDKAEDRVKLFEQHANFEGPSLIISPSMVEGFDFVGDLARFAVIAKASFPYLGDRQVQAKMEQDPEWYDVQVVSAIIQAAGRIVRSDTDWGTTYILDSDAHRVYEKRTEMFPKWFRNAVKVL